MSAQAGGRQPINRKMGYLAIGGVLVIGAIAVMVASTKDPVSTKQEKAEKAARDAVASMPEGTEEKGRDQVESAAQAAERKAAREARERGDFQAFVGGGQPSVAAGTTDMPAIDPELLRQLDEAQREVGGSPGLGSKAATGLPDGLPALGAGAGGGGGDKSGIVYDSYGGGIGTAKEAVGEHFFGEEGGDAQARAAKAAGADGVYEVIRPQAQPSEFVIAQGTAIHAALMTRIDTRNAGLITAMVMRTVYDSRTHRIPLIPQGSRLIGTYDTSVSPGVDRLAVDFQRLVLPDGRAFSLPGFPTSGSDGSIGLVGKYKSNILRAIGPAIVVALAGQAMDRQIKKEIPAADGAAQTPMGAMQSPSVLEQTMPKINEAVMQRYQGAKPYFIAQPGQAMRVVVTADIEVPAPKAGVR